MLTHWIGTRSRYLAPWPVGYWMMNEVVGLRRGSFCGRFGRSVVACYGLDVVNFHFQGLAFRNCNVNLFP